MPSQAASVLAPPMNSIRPNILIVDDRRENLLATEKILKHLNATLYKASSGNEALSLMLRHPFAVVLLDVQMPEMDGFETARLMQEHDAMRGTPIIFITAISKEEKYATQAAEIGAVDYIFKPINPEILKSKITVYLDLYIQRMQIMQLNGTLTQSNEELERFAYICSHDLQEPVRIMRSYAELLEKNYRATLDSDGQRYLGFISNHAMQLQRIIRDILAFSRVGREEIALEEIDCAQLVEQVLSEYESLIAEHHVSIHTGQMPTMMASPTVLRVLLQNLIGNAIKFHDDTREREVHITSEKTQTDWQFTVRDNGIGIDPAFHDRVFMIFQRIHHRHEYPGMGIGLATCKKLVELCGGKIWFESTLGAGTAFHFTLPAQANL